MLYYNATYVNNGEMSAICDISEMPTRSLQSISINRMLGGCQENVQRKCSCSVNRDRSKRFITIRPGLEWIVYTHFPLHWSSSLLHTLKNLPSNDRSAMNRYCDIIKTIRTE